MRLKKYFRILIAVVVMAFCIHLGGGWASAQDAAKVIKVTAKQFEYSPAEITLKKGVPVVLEFTSLDRLHGFSCPALDIRTDIEPGKVNRIEFTPKQAGTFPFHCDNFCGSGHGGMKGKIIVTE
jgi:cytochrome c oxidase subunit 2